VSTGALQKKVDTYLKEHCSDIHALTNSNLCLRMNFRYISATPLNEKNIIKFVKDGIWAYLRATSLLMTDMRAKGKTEQYTV
jgi:hypothetical protein